MAYRENQLTDSPDSVQDRGPQEVVCWRRFSLVFAHLCLVAGLLGAVSEVYRVWILLDRAQITASNEYRAWCVHTHLLREQFESHERERARLLEFSRCVGYQRGAFDRANLAGLKFCTQLLEAPPEPSSP